MAFTFNPSTIQNYVDQNKIALVAKSVLGARTLDYINVQTGVKYKASVSTISSDPTIQAGGCGFSAQGSTSISQREITAPILKVNMEFCDKDIAKTWAGYEVKIAAGKATAPFEQMLTDDIVAKLDSKVDKMIWQGDTTLGVNGFLAYKSEYAAATGTSAKTLVDNVYMALPAAILPNAKIFVGPEVFRSYVQSLVNANLYHYDANDNTGSVIMPGTNTEVVMVGGLSKVGDNYEAYGADPQNLYWGVDMEDDTESFDLWYSKDNQNFRLAINFNGGAQVAFPDQVVYGTSAAL